MSIVSRAKMEAVAKVLSLTEGFPVACVVDLANCGNIRVVRTALSQLVEEGRAIRIGPQNKCVYRLAAVEEAA